MPSTTTPVPPSPAASARFPLAPPPPLSAQRLDRGLHEITVYLLGGTALRDYVKPLGLTVFKAGVTGCRDAEQRAEDCRRKRYASILMRADDPSDPGIELENGDEWFIAPLQEARLDGMVLPSGMAIRNGVIRITMPTSVTVEQVDLALHAFLRPRSLNAYLDSADGQDRLRTAGYDLRARLHTRYTLMTPRPRLSLARELYLIRPWRELGAFVRAIDVVATGLRAQTAVAPGAN